jgi:hypothetical protein
MTARDLATVILWGVLLATSGCGPLQRSTSATAPARDGVSFARGAVILTGSALRDGSGTVLAAISGKVPNFKVRRRAGRCPQVTLRSFQSFEGLDNPHVYVDGTRATDTCILETIQTADVERVEVYPQGFTNRPGYGTHSDGLILVFMRSS